MAKPGSSSSPNGLHPMQVTSGLLEDDHQFTWKIKNFDIVRKSDAGIRNQEYRFKAGKGIGLPVEISVHLSPFSSPENQNQEFVGVFFKVTKVSSTVDEVNVQRTVKIRNLDGSYFFEGFDAFKNLAEKPITGWGFGRVIRQSLPIQSLPLVDGALVIEVGVKLFANQPAVVTRCIQGVMQLFETKSLKQLSKDLEHLSVESHGTGNQDLTTVLVSKDEEKFTVCRAILSARSPVFRAMFQANMQETKTGMVRIEDISGSTLRVLIHYLYSGKLHTDWQSPAVLMELPYAASKYSIELLMEFFDLALGNICTHENAKGLAFMAMQLQLKNASKALFAFIKENATDLEDLMFFDQE